MHTISFLVGHDFWALTVTIKWWSFFRVCYTFVWCFIHFRSSCPKIRASIVSKNYWTLNATTLTPSTCSSRFFTVIVIVSVEFDCVNRAEAIISKLSLNWDETRVIAYVLIYWAMLTWTPSRCNLSSGTLRFCTNIFFVMFGSCFDNRKAVGGTLAKLDFSAFPAVFSH